MATPVLEAAAVDALPLIFPRNAILRVPRILGVHIQARRVGIEVLEQHDVQMPGGHRQLGLEWPQAQSGLAPWFAPELTAEEPVGVGARSSGSPSEATQLTDEQHDSRYPPGWAQSPRALQLR
eukprot:1854225-Amphidinium_carterae.2